MSEHVFFTTTCLVLGAVLAVFAMRYVSAVAQAKARFASEAAYRQMAETAAASQAQTAATLSALQTSLAEAAARLTAVEKILKDVG